MKTNHRFFFNNAADMSELSNESVALVVTSPPYPMIEMWDELFCRQNNKITSSLKLLGRTEPFELMHRELDQIWDEVSRIISPGGIVCINIGDATRSIDGHFMLYPNHSRIVNYLMKIGFSPLPEIIWQKPSNSPNKFMGSGMMPPNAYVTQGHEYILILRKGAKRNFNADTEKKLRTESAYFWEERNKWFSDIWNDLHGASQRNEDKTIRKRSAAFPFEIPYRLINMYSLKGDLVVDPFGGLGTTMLAAMTAARNSVSYEILPEFKEYIQKNVKGCIEIGKKEIDRRLENHFQYIKNRINSGKEIKYLNRHYKCPVVTSQEKGLYFNQPVSLNMRGDTNFEIIYSDPS